MVKVVEMDESISIYSQMNEDVGPVILINKFSVNPSESDEFVEVWAEEAENFKGAARVYLHTIT